MNAFALCRSHRKAVRASSVIHGTLAHILIPGLNDRSCACMGKSYRKGRESAWNCRVGPLSKHSLSMGSRFFSINPKQLDRFRKSRTVERRRECQYRERTEHGD